MSWSWFPAGALILIPLALLLALCGWIATVVVSFKEKKFVLFTLFPITHPFAFLYFAFTRFQQMRWSVAFYIIATLAYFGGGKFSEHLERDRLVSYIADLESKGRSFSHESLTLAPVPPDENMWQHPFLAPITRAAGFGEDLDQRYKSFDLQKQGPGVDRIEFPSRRRANSTKKEPNNLRAFQVVHRVALHRLALSNPAFTTNDLPKTWAAAAELALQEVKTAETDYKLLQEALARPSAMFPHAWQDGFEMALPQLMHTKSFCRYASVRARAEILAGQSDEAFRDFETCLKIVDLGKSDLLISRLVQIAEFRIAVEVLKLAAQQHAWTEEQWGAIEHSLSNRPPLVEYAPASIIAERILGYETLIDTADKSCSVLMKEMDSPGLSAKGSPSSVLDAPINLLFSDYTQAALLKQIRMCQEAFEIMITDFEHSVEAAKTQPLNATYPRSCEDLARNHGILAQLLLPALDMTYQRLATTQVEIQLAITASQLERYYLRNNRYPERIEELTPQFVSSIPIDPADGQQLRYIRQSPNSYLLYSVGPNGQDDRGQTSYPFDASDQDNKDDLHRLVLSHPPELPQVKIDP